LASLSKREILIWFLSQYAIHRVTQRPCNHQSIRLAAEWKGSQPAAPRYFTEAVLFAIHDSTMANAGPGLCGDGTGFDCYRTRSQTSGCSQSWLHGCGSSPNYWI
jgi:hypothetical protein